MSVSDPGPDGRARPAEEARGLRRTVERRSATLLVFLYRLPRWVLLLAVFALLAIGMLATGWVGASGLLVLAAFVAWFGYLAWPNLDTGGRLLRLVGVGVLVALAVGEVLGAL